MLNTESQLSDPEAVSVDVVGKKASTISSPKTLIMSKNNGGDAKNTSTKSSSTATKTSASPTKTSSTASSTSKTANPFEWEEVKKARNRINSQRIRERERQQIANLEAERARLWLSNDAIKFQNRYFRDIIAQILEVRNLKRTRAGIGVPGASPGSFAASLGAAGGLGGASSVQLPLSMGGVGGGIDASLLQTSRLPSSTKGFSGLSDADLLARHQATTLEMQTMLRQQEAIDRLGAGGSVGMSGLGMNLGGMNMNSIAASPYADMADNIRIRQLMLQQSAASGDIDAGGLLSSIGAGASNPLAANVVGNTGGLDALNGSGGGALGDFGSGMSDAELLQITKRQKFGF